MQPLQCLDLSFNDLIHTAKTDLSLVGKVITRKQLNQKAIIVVLTTSWNLELNLAIKVYDNNIVTCSFNRLEDRDRVLNSGPWSIKGALLNLQIWSPSLTLEEVDFTYIEMWIQIHNLPPNRMNGDNIRKVGNVIGTLSFCEKEYQLCKIRKFVRIKACVNIIKPLTPGCFIK